MKIIYYPQWMAVFFCQDKNASTTLKTSLDEHCAEPPIMYWDESTIRTSPRSMLEDIQSQPIEFQFTIVRNTWDRISSLFHMLSGQLEKEYPGKPKGRLHQWFGRYESDIVACLASCNPFDRFVEFVCGQTDDQVDSHWQPQTTHLPLGDQRLFIANFDNLQSDWEQIARQLGISGQQLSISNNRTSHTRRHFSDDYSEGSARRIRERYAEEIERFGFEFESMPVKEDVL